MGYHISDVLFDEFYDAIFAILGMAYLQEHNISFFALTEDELSLIEDETQKTAVEFLESYNITDIKITK